MMGAAVVRTDSSTGAESSLRGAVPRRRPLRFGGAWWGIGWLAAVTVVALSLLPTLGPVLPGGDKLQHALAYFAMTAWFCNLTAPRLHTRVGLRFLAMGGVLELLQGFTGYRSSEWLDLLADAVGIVLAVLACRGKLGGVLANLDRRLAARSGR